VERFSAANLCPKCQSAAASYKFHTVGCPQVGASGEHMHRQCPSCAYEWAEMRHSPRTHVDGLLLQH
jgi:predicted amidophosphoribosyltransferase